MIRISFKTEPYWLDLALGARFLVRPPGTSILVAAGEDMAAARDQIAAAGPVEMQEPGATDAGEPVKSPATSGRVNFARAVARAAILEWEGVEDDKGKPLPVSPEAVDAVMEVWAIFSAFERHYVQPALIVSTEGNA